MEFTLNYRKPRKNEKPTIRELLREERRWLAPRMVREPRLFANLYEHLLSSIQSSKRLLEAYDSIVLHKRSTEFQYPHILVVIYSREVWWREEEHILS